MFLVAVNCSHPAATCFCASTGDGPEAQYGFDLVLDELDDGYIVRSGSPAGGNILRELFLEPAADAQRTEAQRQNAAAAAQQTRQLPGRNLRDTLFANLEHARWDDVAARCLSCGNCTSVCPTCFCHSERDEPALDGHSSTHYRQWDSCFTEGHSYIHGIVIRAETKFRYRQWLTHKLGSWHEQFGRSGCVGCGRCISWCPAAIDITEEAAAICG
jgi:ferredoxin